MKKCQIGIFGLFSILNYKKKDKKLDIFPLYYKIFKPGINKKTKSMILCIRDRFFEKVGKISFHINVLEHFTYGILSA